MVFQGLAALFWPGGPIKRCFPVFLDRSRNHRDGYGVSKHCHADHSSCRAYKLAPPFSALVRRPVRSGEARVKSLRGGFCAYNLLLKFLFLLKSEYFYVLGSVILLVFKNF